MPKTTMLLDAGSRKSLKDIDRLMEMLPKKAAKKALRRSISKASTPLVRAIKQAAPKQSGTLKKAIKRKVKTYANTGNSVAIIGADRNVVGADAKGRKRVPANYLHLVEKGHAGPHPAPAHPVVEPAYEAAKQTIANDLQSETQKALEEEARKL